MILCALVMLLLFYPISLCLSFIYVCVCLSACLTSVISIHFQLIEVNQCSTTGVAFDRAFL